MKGFSKNEGKKNGETKAAQIEISLEALALALNIWHNQITQAQQGNDIRTLQNLLTQFVCKIELDYNQAKIWYTYPLDSFDTSDSKVFHWGHKREALD